MTKSIETIIQDADNHIRNLRTHLDNLNRLGKRLEGYNIQQRLNNGETLPITLDLNSPQTPQNG